MSTITLHRRNPDDPERVEYWEAWQSEARVVTLHQGAVGEIGLTAAVKVPLFGKGEKVLARELALADADGFAPLSPKDFAQMVLQLPMDESPTADTAGDLARVQAAEGLCAEVLGWTGNGASDGHDMGAGTMTVFLETVAPEAAVATVVGALHRAGEFNFTLAVRNGEGFRVVWPDQPDH